MSNFPQNLQSNLGGGFKPNLNDPNIQKQATQNMPQQVYKSQGTGDMVPNIPQTETFGQKVTKTTTTQSSNQEMSGQGMGRERLGEQGMSGQGQGLSGLSQGITNIEKDVQGLFGQGNVGNIPPGYTGHKK